MIAPLSFVVPCHHGGADTVRLSPAVFGVSSGTQLSVNRSSVSPPEQAASIAGAGW